MRDPEQGAIRPAGQHVPERQKGGRISRTIIRRAIREGRALLTSDAMQDSRFSSRESILMKQIHSVICVPVAVLGDFTGVLYLAADDVQNMFTEDQLELVAAFADQIGLATSHLRMRQRERESLMSTIRALVRAAELRNPERRGHSERVAAYAVAIARQLRLKADQIQAIRLAALLHDVGQIGEDGEVPRDAEDEAGLTHDQLRVRHTLEIIREMACYRQIESAIRFQLERMDGSGPEELRGRDIPLEARILAVSTIFDNRVCLEPDRPRREAAREALAFLRERAGAKLDEEVVVALATACEQGRIDFAAPDYGPTDSEWNPAPRSEPATEPDQNEDSP
jgi:response regulator RpfG family c-di-GMP phosphodiesterase